MPIDFFDASLAFLVRPERFHAKSFPIFRWWHGLGIRSSLSDGSSMTVRSS
jgi:hypothetical protein